MSDRIEWSEGEGIEVVAPGDVNDNYGNTNELWAVVGPGFCIEGDPEKLAKILRGLASELVAIAKEEKGEA